jgi:protein O-mannosyl-transferase
MAMYFYLKGRTGDTIWKNATFFALAAFSGVLSVGSKENAAMLPVSLFLFDLFLIQGATIENIRKNWAICLFALILVPAIAFMYYDFSSIIGNYDIARPFTMWERLLTQPRVILFYISLLLYPITSHLMLIHPVEISKSLLDPWTTIAAIVVILLILLWAVLTSRKEGTLIKWLEKHAGCAYALLRIMTGPLISYCIIFFFLNHLIEGSFISLQLVYEHRNYLPSMLFFVPVSIFIVYGLSYFEKRKRMIAVLSPVITAIIIIIGVNAHTYNEISKDEISLWEHNAEKAPDLDIVHNNLGVALLKAGRFPEAFAELTKALESRSICDVAVKFNTYHSLGDYYLLRGDAEKADLFYEKALEWFSSSADIYNNRAAILIKKKKLEEAEIMLKKAISLQQDNAYFHITLGKIYLYRGYPDQTIKEAQKANSLGGDQLEAYWLMSEAFKEKRDYRMSDHFRRLALGSELTKKRCP